jgi:hypothetical protein
MKIQKTSTIVSPFAGISFVNYEFDKVGMSQLIDSELGARVKTIGFSFSDIIKNLCNVFYSGGDCAEDIQTHLGKHLKSIPGNSVPSADTILRGIKEVATKNSTFGSKQGNMYDFNINTKLNTLNIKSLLFTKQLEREIYYDSDYDNQIIATEKYNTKRTYKHCKGYCPGVATIGNKIVYIENRDGNANVKFEQASTLSRAYDLLKENGIKINRSRMDAGSYSKDIINIVISLNATKQETKTANQLSEYLKAVYPACRFSVTTVINENNRSVQIGLPGQLSLDESVKREIPLQEEGFLIRSLNGKNVVIVSSSVKGLFNAVYSLLEKLGYGFYLSFEAIPVPKNELLFNEWEMSDSPIQSERIVFNWHNFLSGCTGWNYEDWCSWIDQNAKMRFNTIMVHAYGNNPMFSFEYNEQKKEVGYLTTSKSGRDWGAQHVNDVRRLPGGEVFSGQVLGSNAAMVSDDQRGDAATKLMARVFEHADEMAMKINFAIDVDTWSANPKNIIESLPAECRIKLEKQDIVNPETIEGYKYYKAQVKIFLTSYPQITTIRVWVRRGGTLWRDIKPTQFPKLWQNEWKHFLIKYPELENDKQSASTYALSKVVIAYQKALKEMKCEDITIAFGSWIWGFLPSAAILMPSDCPLIPLDQDINFDSDETQKLLSKVGRIRKLIPIVWAQHDDRRYMGKPYTAYANFNNLLKECNASGFGIIHWTTRPLDLFFKSLADQVWSKSENKSITSTLSAYNRTVFGPQQQALYDYMTDWIVRGPMFGRETSPHFFDLGYELTEVMMERTKNRIDLLKKVNQSKLSDMGKKTFNYYASMEQFYLSLFQNQDKFSKAYAMLGRQSLDSAKTILETVAPEKTIEIYAKASTILPITSGEKALIMSMVTRWLPDFLNLKQRSRMANIYYKFAKTQHDALAQAPGKATYYIDENKTLWSCMGEKELNTGVAGFFCKNEAGDLPENSLTYMLINTPFTFSLVTIGGTLLSGYKSNNFN